MKLRRYISLAFLVVYLATTMASAYVSLTCACCVNDLLAQRETTEHVCCHSQGGDTAPRVTTSSCHCTHHVLSENIALYLDTASDRANHPTYPTLQFISGIPNFDLGFKDEILERIPAPRSIPLHSYQSSPLPLRGPPALA